MNESKRRSVRALAAVCLAAWSLALAGAGCRTPQAATSAAFCLLDGFEDDPTWALDSADNYGQVEFGDRGATQGRRAMQLTFYDNGRGKTMFRREVNYSLGGASAVMLDVLNRCAEPGVQCALAFVTERGFFETAARGLAPGENNGIVFDVTAAGLKDSGKADAWMASRDAVTRIMLLVFPGGARQGTLAVDNLRIDACGADRSPLPHVTATSGIVSAVACFTPREVRVEIDAASIAARPADPPAPALALAPVDLQLRLTDPEGSRRTLHGFLKTAPVAATNAAVYAVRFLLDREGLWRLSLGCVTGRRWTPIAEADVRAGKAPARGGFARVCAADPARFELSTGEPLYPAGQNVCWAADYEPYFKAIRDYGGNFARVWICPWNNPLLTAERPDEIDLRAADAIDRIFELAAEYGIYVQLVLTYHGALGEDWSRSPFNKANGGPCAVPSDFWTSDAARSKFKWYMDYLVRRWAAYPQLFAWELINEADLTPRYADEDVARWHEEMGGWLKRNDPYGHLVTTSVVGHEPLFALWDLDCIDFAAEHRYGPDAVAGMSAAGAGRDWRRHKPFWVQEFGRGWDAADDQGDPDGRHLQAALWVSRLTEAGGLALPWWWDTYVEAKKLQRRFAPVAAFARDETLRGREVRAWSARIHEPGDRTVHVQCLISRSACFGYVCDPQLARDPTLSPRRPLLGDGHRIELWGMLDGDYAVEFWDAAAGKVRASARAECREGRLAVALPASDTDFAFKIRSPNPSLAVRVQ